MMPASQPPLPKWILIVSALFALLEIVVSALLCFMPQMLADTVDINAKGVDYLIYMVAARQLALGIIFGYATIKRSLPMLILAYIFFLVMMIGEIMIGVVQKDNGVLIGALVMAVVCTLMIFALNKKR